MDTKKDNITETDNSGSSNSNSMLNMQGVIKKTQKISAAIYLVTDLFEQGEPLRAKLRGASIKIIESLHLLQIARPVEKHVLFNSIAEHIAELLSYIEIGKMIAQISEMNAGILERELQALLSGILKNIDKNKEESFGARGYSSSSTEGLALTDEYFHTGEILPLGETTQGDITTKGLPQTQTPAIKGRFFKGHVKDLHNVLYNKDSEFFKHVKDSFGQTSNAQTKGQSNHSDAAVKINRRNNIIRLIKEKKEVMIKDISSLILDCSEKTIQRELNTLVSEGVLKRIGEKRWSRYTLN